MRVGVRLQIASLARAEQQSNEGVRNGIAATFITDVESAPFLKPGDVNECVRFIRLVSMSGGPARSLRRRAKIT